MSLPKLKVSRITNLQDARYCAAEGIHFLSFSLERGYDQKLSVQTVWNIANWLEGPEYVVELNAISMDELKEVEQSVSVRYASLPVGDWSDFLWSYADAFILRASHDFELKLAQDLIQKAHSEGKELLFEIYCKDLKEAQKWKPIFEYIFLHLRYVDNAETLIKSGENYPFGISLSYEIEEEPGMLDYDKTGKILDAYQEKSEMADD